MSSCLARVRVFRGATLLGALLAVGCGRGPAPVALDFPTRFPAATRAALRLAGAVDERGGWAGGDLVLVQTGDQLDRGDDEPEILDLLERLTAEATAAGGAVHVLNGNHEVLNVKGDFRYVTLDGFADFLDEPLPGLAGATPETVVAAMLARAGAFKPGGPMASRLAARNVVVVVGETVFVHGGVLPEVAEYGIERLNQEAREWLRGERSGPPDLLLDGTAPSGAATIRRTPTKTTAVSSRRRSSGSARRAWSSATRCRRSGSPPAATGVSGASTSECPGTTGRPRGARARGRLGPRPPDGPSAGDPGAR